MIVPASAASRCRAIGTLTVPKQSAGILMYRRSEHGLEVLLVHPGGPFWAKKDLGAWSIPKGEYSEREDALTVALREFEEETGAAPARRFSPAGRARAAEPEGGHGLGIGG